MRSLQGKRGQSGGLSAVPNVAGVEAAAGDALPPQDAQALANAMDQVLNNSVNGVHTSNQLNRSFNELQPMEPNEPMEPMEPIEPPREIPREGRETVRPAQ
ncbi:MAG: hypothetical protein ACKVGZ_15690 [Alphaproteobacteria bacterium]|jgi:hypothetical protein